MLHFQVFAKLTALSRRESEGEESLDLTDHLRESNSGSWPVVEAAVRPLWLETKKILDGFHAELLPQALTEGECERRVQGQYGVGIQHASSRYGISNIQRSFSPKR